jgi:hypothetical protein
VVDYLISQRDERVERAEQVAAVRQAYGSNLEMGFPVVAGTTTFMPVPGGVVGDVREMNLQDFRDVFALAQQPSIVERFHTDEYFAENFVAGLGDYEDDFRDSPVSGAHRRFLNDPTSVEDEIKARNRRRTMPYEYLQSSLIPNSTDI